MPRIKSGLTYAGVAGFLVALLVAGCQELEEERHALAERSGLSTEPAYEGAFGTRIQDNLDGTSRTFHVLKNEGEAVEVTLAEGVEILSGTVVRAFGEFDDEGTLEIGEFEVVVSAPLIERTIDPEPRAPRRIAMVSVFWNGTGMPNEEAKSKLFTASTSTNNYYREVSYGVEKLTGTVYGPYQIPDPGGCNVDAISKAAVDAVKEHGHPNVELEHDQFMYYFPRLPDCEWAGLAMVGRPDRPARDSWYNGASGCVVLAQEIGHNYGMGHSRSYDCTENGVDVPFSDDCDYEEYGHPYDPMGGGCGHMNQVQKGYMGWLGGCNAVTVTRDGTFNLLPTELPCDGAQTIRFATHDGRFFYVEYRRPLGQFDDPGQQWSQGLSGVLMHVGPDFDRMTGPINCILDMNDGPGAFMHTGDLYTAFDDVVTVEVLDEFDTHAVVEVTFPGGGKGAPICLDGTVPANENGHYGPIECAAEPNGPDVTAPEVAITYPLDGAGFEPGADFDITAEGTDDEGIVDMLLYLNGEPQHRTFAPPWGWTVAHIPAGEYEFAVLASDGVNQTPSEAVYVTVAEGATKPEEDTDGEGDGDLDTEGEGGCGCDQSRPQCGGSALALFLLGFGLCVPRCDASQRGHRPRPGLLPSVMSRARSASA